MQEKTSSVTGVELKSFKQATKSYIYIYDIYMH